MTTRSSPSSSSTAFALFLLPFLAAACSSTPPSPPAPPEQASDPKGAPPLAEAPQTPDVPGEEWRKEAMAWLDKATKGPPNEFDNTPFRLKGLLDKPDPPAVVGPELKVLPAGKDALPWPAPNPNVLTVRYRIQRRDCGAGADMGCNVVALCPVDSPYSKAPVARLVHPVEVTPQPISEVVAKTLEVPSAQCELRLYARDHHYSRTCTARGPAIKLPRNGERVVDLGTFSAEGISCESDLLVDRMLLRYDLVETIARRKAKKP